MPEYTALAVLSVVGTVLAEVLWLRTGIFRRAQYWIAMAIVYAFHVLVDGWLTKLSAPIVIYDEGRITGVRVPWDIPVEDYLFGFAMITLTLLLWVRLGRRTAGADSTARTTRTEGSDSTEGADSTARTTTQEAP
jgi:lycopene cyclase domain-containing protein